MDATEQANEQPAWYFDDNTPGQGDRPDWLEVKYNKVSDQAKAYKELEKKLGNNPAPEDYDWGSYKDVFDVENPHLASLKSKAKEMRLSQEAFNNLVDPLAKYHQSLLPDTDAEIAKLGEHANAKIDTVNRWASNHLSEKSLDTLGKVSNTAEMVELMDEIRQLHHQTISKVPSSMNNVGMKATVITPEMVQREIETNYAKYSNDPDYRYELQQKLKQAYGE
jgi:hypothetical protein